MTATAHFPSVVTPITSARRASTNLAGNARNALVKCSKCSLRHVCLPVGLSETDLCQLDGLVRMHRAVKRGEALYRTAEPFESLFAVRAGSFKTLILHGDGREQVTGFQMGGELLGLDGIGTEHHTCEAIALEDSSVCVIPFHMLEQLSHEVSSIQRQVHRIMSQEIVREHGVMMLLGSMRAEERLATFLLNLSQRLLARGYSPSEFNLRMTRDEIGSYLGMKLETVSRTFSRFQEIGLLAAQQKQIRILDIAGLQKVVAH
jgi:CRP/FNR family transcriptional regulator, anaerobic regulatory protein